MSFVHCNRPAEECRGSGELKSTLRCGYDSKFRNTEGFRFEVGDFKKAFALCRGAATRNGFRDRGERETALFGLYNWLTRLFVLLIIICTTGHYEKGISE